MIVGGLIILLLAVTVLMHYQGLRIISSIVEVIKIPPHARMVVVVLGVIVVHTIEIATYATGYLVADLIDGTGDFVGLHDTLISDTTLSAVPRTGLSLSFYDYFYFSAETFASLGLGDIYPVGGLRMIASFEVLSGLILIGWSASFTYIAMRKFWELHIKRDRWL
tara:strand:- start:797 stop:1291 length:495 start_codon:yes stop_codon:yes gene_type:complete